MTSRRALISVYHKEGIAEFARDLVDLGWILLSTGGTARLLREAGLEVKDVSEATGHPECFDGRVKTLHPAVHSGLLARRNNSDDMETLESLGYAPIDLVCVNLYPFEATASRNPPVTDSELIEMIDIGGPTMIRSAAKNHQDVLVVTSSEQYPEVIESLSSTGGDPTKITHSLRSRLALRAFQRTAAYDAAVSSELDNRIMGEEVPTKVHISTDEGTSLRYGENPHQPAAFYPNAGEKTGLSAALQHGGKPLSYNNYLDLDGALRLARSLIASGFENDHGCVVIKHTNPCGASVDKTQEGAWTNALESDPESAFGCVIAFTKPVQKKTAEAIGNHFFECMIAPGYEPGALEILSQKKNRRMLTLPSMKPRENTMGLRQLDGGWLAQVQGPTHIQWDSVQCVTDRELTETEMNLAKFGTTVISEVKSNAILLVSSTTSGFATVGVGPGQTSRVEAVRIAARRAGDRAMGSMMVSDAFFPFRDGVDAASEIGVTSIIQPGGSMRDSDSIDAANEHGISMIFTHKRLFLH
ncbi:MAG TPA: bifunctional phosphoribosylaminoimidazolecarboxamide formyltransferase/IMP cyclohydrolase [Candidatus Thalassarchaeaceae archaeon]|nr:MAG TPA: bifunctional phosphoribosylaminoimidazolecarboxamide formyltransferase/IMP cyclohydrolase PurH [Candidatus Poseidoniales archaeon]HII90424.1 bifunctional phosphoribosylaminoimidazolecarboxamide formyltransferase/IMP cyclohydrolase [Candidatus Thalassarchaeaceae archaeon]